MVRDTDQLPPMMDYDIRHGRTYMYFKGAPLYPFGFGLSYTTFAYSALHPSETTLSGDGSIDVRVDVKNTGPRKGDEVVQLYASHPASKVPRPNRQLVGFAGAIVGDGDAVLRHERILSGSTLQVCLRSPTIEGFPDRRNPAGCTQQA